MNLKNDPSSGLRPPSPLTKGRRDLMGRHVSRMCNTYYTFQFAFQNLFPGLVKESVKNL